MWSITPAVLKDYFPEIKHLASRCNFRDCSHTHEPGCAVKDGVGTGEITSARYATYLRILECLRAEAKIY